MLAIGRQGDLHFISIAMPADRTGFTTEARAVLAGSHDGSHVVEGPCERKIIDAGTQEIILALPTKITHAARHSTRELPAGAIRVITARTADGLVVD